MNINPYFLDGPWDWGRALDQHTISSEFLGDDPFGNPTFETVRSDIGELIFLLKYRSDSSVLNQIVNTAKDFLEKQGILDRVDIVLPAPPSKKRTFQPVFLIAEEIANQAKKFYSEDALIKIDATESKSMTPEQKKSLKESVKFTKKLNRPCNILLIDDIYKTGSTLNACVQTLREDPNTGEIFVLTMTKTKNQY